MVVWDSFHSRKLNLCHLCIITYGSNCEEDRSIRVKLAKLLLRVLLYPGWRFESHQFGHFIARQSIQMIWARTPPILFNRHWVDVRWSTTGLRPSQTEIILFINEKLRQTKHPLQFVGRWDRTSDLAFLTNLFQPFTSIQGRRFYAQFNSDISGGCFNCRLSWV